MKDQPFGTEKIAEMLENAAKEHDVSDEDLDALESIVEVLSDLGSITALNDAEYLKKMTETMEHFKNAVKKGM